jgi:hypothetical protein
VEITFNHKELKKCSEKQTTRNEYYPPIVFHPGETLLEKLEEMP